MNGRMVLYIDGPLKGRLKESGRPPQYHDADSLLSLEAKTYFWYQVTMFGRVVWIGSVHDALAGVIERSSEALWDLLVSSEAKQAAQP